MTATMESATMESATMKSAAVESATMESAAVEFAAVESVTVEPITMESAEAFAAEEALVISAIAPVRRIAVASVIPPSVETSRQAEESQPRARQRQPILFSLPDASAGGENDERSGGHPAGLATAGPAFRTPAGVPT